MLQSALEVCSLQLEERQINIVITINHMVYNLQMRNFTPKNR